MGRPASVLVTVRESQLAIVVPAGESAVFGPEQLTQLEQLHMVLARGINGLHKRRAKSWPLPGSAR